MYHNYKLGWYVALDTSLQGLVISATSIQTIIPSSYHLHFLEEKQNLKLETLAELHRPEAHIWCDRSGQPMRSATGIELES